MTSNDPMNLDNMPLFDLEEISVKEWHPLPDGQGKPEQVHLWVKLVGMDATFVVSFKSPRPIDELIVALITHRKGVFG